MAHMEHRRPFLALLHGRDGVPRDREAAVALCHTTLASALEDSPLVTAEARANLAYCQLLGLGTPRDPATAAATLRTAGDAGSARAWCLLAYCFQEGFGVDKNPSQQRRLFRLAANAGDPLAEARCRIDGIDCAVNQAEAARQLHIALDEWPGCVFSQTVLGWCYANGEGVPQDHAEAVRLFTLAAGQGFANAQFNLGYCFEYGEGVQQDHTEAVRWYTMAADQGYASAQFNLGLCFANGRGVLQSYSEAVRLYTLAALQGDADSQFILGLCFTKGQGVPQDHVEAARWYTRTANQNYTRGILKLAECFKNGVGVSQSTRQARLHYHRAMLLGCDDSRARLNTMMHGVFWQWTGPLRTVYPRSFYSRLHCALWCGQRAHASEHLPYLPVEMWGAIFGFLPFEPHV